MDHLPQVPVAHQWLPTDFDVSATGAVKARGYINNLHPTRHRSLYGPISAIFARFVPLFENEAVTDCGGPGSAPAS